MSLPNWLMCSAVQRLATPPYKIRVGWEKRRKGIDTLLIFYPPDEQQAAIYIKRKFFNISLNWAHSQIVKIWLSYVPLSVYLSVLNTNYLVSFWSNSTKLGKQISNWRNTTNYSDLRLCFIYLSQKHLRAYKILYSTF